MPGHRMKLYQQPERMKRMTLQQCRYIMEIERCRSLTEAAKRLFVTQPSITKAVRELEKELGITILKRTNRGIDFTPEGKELASYARLLVEQADAVRSRFTGKHEPTPLKLTIASQHYHFVTPALAALIGEMADRSYEIALREGKGTDVVEQVGSGAASVGILCASSLNQAVLERKLAAYGLVFTQLATLPEHVILSKCHPLSAFATLRPEQLAPYPYITFRKDDTLLDITEGYFTIGRASRQIFVEDRATMNYLVVHTDSYCLGTGCLSEGFIPPDIVPIPLDVPWNLCVGYLQRKDALLSEECLRFIRHLRQALQDSLPLRS